MALLVVGVMACGADLPPDLRYATPRATLGTLFEAWGVDALTAADVEARKARGRGFHLSDPASFRGCFADWEQPADEALAGYVFGVLAPAKDALRVVPGAERTLVFAEDAPPVVLRRDEGGWRIVLGESVPASTRRHLGEAARDLETERAP